MELGKENLKKSWEHKFKLAGVRRSECGHNYMWPYSFDKNLSCIHSLSYCSKALNSKCQTASNQPIQEVVTVTPRDPRIETSGGTEAKMCPRGLPQLLRQVIPETDLSLAR